MFNATLNEINCSMGDPVFGKRDAYEARDKTNIERDETIFIHHLPSIRNTFIKSDLYLRKLTAL